MIYSNKFNDEEKQALRKLQKDLRWSDYLLDSLIACIGFISDFDSKYRNSLPISRAGGYMGLTPKQCKKLKLSTDKLISMASTEQIALMYKLLSPHQSFVQRPIDILMIFLGLDVRKSDSNSNCFVSELQYKPKYKKLLYLPKSKVEEDLNKFFEEGKYDKSKL